MAPTIVGRDGLSGRHWRATAAVAGFAVEPFDTAGRSSVLVDSTTLVMVCQNYHSVPVSLAGRRVLARVGAREITWFATVVRWPRHERPTERFESASG